MSRMSQMSNCLVFHFSEKHEYLEQHFSSDSDKKGHSSDIEHNKSQGKGNFQLHPVALPSSDDFNDSRSNSSNTMPFAELFIRLKDRITGGICDRV